jgi:hypothetical protein
MTPHLDNDDEQTARSHLNGSRLWPIRRLIVGRVSNGPIGMEWNAWHVGLLSNSAEV